MAKHYYRKSIDEGDARSIYNLAITNNESLEIRVQPDDMSCLICREDSDKLINLNCKLNERHYDHGICRDCATIWYENNKYTCILCQEDIDFDNIFLAVKVEKLN
jgi:hypothetical protein